MFDYLGILISVILGLALTHLLTGCSRLIEHRHRVRIYWVQLVWVATVLVYVLAIWWGMYWWRHLNVWTIQTFLFLAFYAMVQFVMASLLFPHDLHDHTDMQAFFMKNRRWFFGSLLLALLLDVPETLLKGVAHLRGVPVQYLIFMPTVIALTITGLVTANRRVHAALAPAWLLSLVAYMTLTSLDQITAR